MQSVQPSPVSKHRILEIPITPIPRNSPPPRQKDRSSPTSIPLTNMDSKFDTNRSYTPSSTYSFTFPGSFPSPVPQYTRAVGMSENPAVSVSFAGHNRPPLIEIGLNDLPKSGNPMAPLIPLGTTPLTTPSKSKCVALIHTEIPIKSNPSKKNIEKSKKNVECISYISPPSSPTMPKSLTPILAIPQKFKVFQKSTRFEQQEASITPPVPNNSPTTNT